MIATDDAAWTQTTKALAEAVRLRFQTDFGLAVGGATAPAADSSETPVVAVALASRDGITVRTVPYTGHSAILKPRVAKQALNMLRLELMKR